MFFSPPNISATHFLKISRTALLSLRAPFQRKMLSDTQSNLLDVLILRSSSVVPPPFSMSPFDAMALSLPAAIRPSAKLTNLLNCSFTAFIMALFLLEFFRCNYSPCIHSKAQKVTIQ